MTQDSPKSTQRPNSTPINQLNAQQGLQALSAHPTPLRTGGAAPLTGVMPGAGGSLKVSDKSGVAALLLHLLLPTFGASLFYSGKVGLGLLWLALFLVSLPLMMVFVGLFVWMALGIWWIVDLIAICTGNFRDAQGRVIKV